MDDLLQALKADRPVILPTETVYGLFAPALSETAVDRVYALKGRPRDKAMNLNVASLEEIYAYSKDQPAYLPELCRAFLPGPLTIILAANDQVPPWVNAGGATVGFRMPRHPVTQALIAEAGPLIGPSANLSGQPSGSRFAAVADQFGPDVPGYADDAAITGQDSTILDISGSRPVILRQGAIQPEAISRTVPQIRFS